MSTFLIHENNMERLENKLKSLSKKCAQTHCSFKYEILGTQFKDYELEDGSKITAKFYEVEVDGTAKYEGWEFVATIDHHTEGNVIRAYNTELIVPDKYKTCGPTCEHCNKIRSRKDTYLVYNSDLNEFKQVGKSCLKEFTNGLSAEDIAFFVSIYTQCESNTSYTGSDYKGYIEVESFLRYAFECYKNWGYQKSASSFYDEIIPEGYRSTVSRVTDYYYINSRSGRTYDMLKDEMDSVNFNADSEYATQNAAAALHWIRNISEDKLKGSEYLRNLHIIASDRYTEWRSLGILVSLTVTYMRHIGEVAAYEKKQKEAKEQQDNSEYVGSIGDRLDVTTNNFACVSSWNGYYGMTYLYKFTDESNNVFVWYATNPVEDPERVVSVKGTVKDHAIYNEAKQTVLTRCKVTLSEKKEEPKKELPEGFVPVTDVIDNLIDDMFS